jgi:rhodanese-related sulfurtransferase
MKKLIICSVLCCFRLLGLFAQNGGLFKSLNVSEFENAIKDTSVVVVDVRSAEEHAAGYIVGTAFNIDVLKDTFANEASAILPKDKTIAVYCRSGRRSKVAAGILAKAGFKVLDLDTGFNGWAAAGKPIVTK